MDTSLYFWKPNNVKSAISARMTPLSVDFDAKTGVFPSSRGNKTYTCSLSECPCTDFSINRKPCKHMIRLAHELHVITLDGVQSSRAAAEEKQSISIADEFIKNKPLLDVLAVFRIADALVNGLVVTDDQISFIRHVMPCLVTEKGALNSKALPVYQAMKTRLNNRLGLLLVEHIAELPNELVHALCYLDDPSYMKPYAVSLPVQETNSTQSTKKSGRPAVSMENLISQLTQNGISYKDLRAQGGCLWIESTGRADALLKDIFVDGFFPVLVPESRHFSGRRAWYIK